jgi:hypothetical protein
LTLGKISVWKLYSLRSLVLRLCTPLFLGRPTLSKFMAIPYYAYLVLKMPGPRGVISIRGDVKWAFDYDWESCETADRLMTSIELQ